MARRRRSGRRGARRLSGDGGFWQRGMVLARHAAGRRRPSPRQRRRPTARSPPQWRCEGSTRRREAIGGATGGRCSLLRRRGAAPELVARPLEHQARAPSAVGSQPRLQRDDRRGEVEHDAHGSRRRLAGAHDWTTPAPAGSWKAGARLDAGRSTTRRSGPAQRQGLVVAGAIEQRSRRGCRSRPAPAPGRDFTGTGEVPGQRGQQRGTEEELLQGGPLDAHGRS